MTEIANKRGRKLGFRMSDEHRGKIRCTNIIRALQECALGEREMGAVQVQAARILLAKVLPDISAVQISGDPSAPLQTRLTVSWEAVDVTPAPKQLEHKPEKK